MPVMIDQPGRPSWRRVRPLLALCAAVAMLATPAADTGRLPRRLVVGLDGLGFADVQAAQALGAFQQFHPVSRLVSTFPSISDIAWSEIYRTSPPAGYQRVYFDLDENKKVGGPIDPIRPIEFELRMHLGFVQKRHHLSSYLSPGRTARSELSTLTQRFFASRGVETFFAYLPAPDAMQHVRGNLGRYLSALNREITLLLRTYKERTGADLELVMVSDHGNNQRFDAQTIDLEQFLENRGYHADNDLSSPREVAFSTDGVTTGLGVFVRPTDVQPLAQALAALRGVEFVTATSPVEGPDVCVDLRDSLGGAARICRHPDGALAYRPGIGDPLRYGPLMARLKADGALDAQGFAPEAAWFEATREHQFPAALDRIVRGHYDVTSNPAPILVSIKDGYQVASGMVSFFNQLRPLGGTHGGLNAVNSLGIVMSTFQPTRDASSHTVADQFDGFQALAPLRRSSTRRR